MKVSLEVVDGKTFLVITRAKSVLRIEICDSEDEVDGVDFIADSGWEFYRACLNVISIYPE